MSGWGVWLAVCAGAAAVSAGPLTAPSSVCPSMDLRSDPDTLDEVANCTVIDGFLLVVLIHTGNLTGHESYPLLQEVTEFVIFYSVRGLTSIGRLFPNLRLIRGRRLFLDHALSVFDMPHLTEIALVGLTILRGSVAIIDNPNLCYVDTVDWDEVGRGPHLLRLRESSCPECPEYCPRGCWNASHCQRPPYPGLCHPLCLGGCSGPGPDNCVACRQVKLHGVCYPACPNKNTYMLLNNFCVTEEACQQMKPANRSIVDMEAEGVVRMDPFGGPVNRRWFVWEDRCVSECPVGLEITEKNGQLSCRSCPNGPCTKVCPEGVIDSIQKADSFKGCTHISGTLEINVMNVTADLSEELHRSLGQLQAIDGQLIVKSSGQLVNLHFFQNLTRISGRVSAMRKYYEASIIVQDNPDLEDLFDWTRPAGENLILSRGGFFFHFNPKLCLQVIKKLGVTVNYTKWTEVEVSTNTNGVESACNIMNTTVEVSFRDVNNFTLRIERPKDGQIWDRFMVFYKEAPFKNITSHYEDGCSKNVWKLNDFVEDERDGFFNVTITSLRPFTQYAYFVRTYFVKGDVGHTPIRYIRTMPSRPSSPVNIVGYSNSSDEIVLSWSRPIHQNGNLTLYIIMGTLLKEKGISVYKESDACLHRKSLDTNIPAHIIEAVEKGRMLVDNTNQVFEDDPVCDSSSGSHLLSQPSPFYVDDSSPSLDKCMTQYLNEAMIKPRLSFLLLPDQVTEKPVVPDTSITMPNLSEGIQESGEIDESLGESDESFEKYVSYGINSVSINGLKHYSTYLIKMKACRRMEPGESLHRFYSSDCSFPYILTLRTQKVSSVNYDVINAESIIAETVNRSAFISWKAPENLNGIVVGYTIEINNTNKQTSRTPCISAENFTIYHGKNIEVNDYGTYTIRIKTFTTAGEGQFSNKYVFSVEEDSYAFVTALVTVLVSVVIILALLGVIIIRMLKYFYKKRFQEKNVLFKTINPEYVSVSGGYLEDDWEISREDVELVREIKQGNFGVVYEGLLLPENKRVAVKTLIGGGGDREGEFLKEASVMKSFSEAHHVVKLLGVVSRGQPAMVVMELMALGDLKSFLRMTQDSAQYPPPTPARFHHMAGQIADGLVYLEAYKFVHRDLAARNCMVSEDLTVKIGDFGMTRDIYETDYYRKGNKGLLPIRWMAPESLNDGVFTSQSDVWSYGVVLWEMLTLAAQPYQGMSNEQVLQHVLSGNRLDPPLYCPPLLRSIMTSCWKWKPKARPTFGRILCRLESCLPEEFKAVSYFHSEEGSHQRPEPCSVEADAPLLPPPSPSSSQPSFSFSRLHLAASSHTNASYQ